MTDVSKPTGLDLLRAPFPAHLISKLPKESKAQSEERKTDRSKGVNCQVCGGWHHRNAVHLDYVGHAALTDRLLDADQNWSWEPLAVGQDNLPLFDKTGGLWIKLTVCGVTRLGYGHADSKPNADAGAREKEVIGDALRNAAMRFGAALDLWHKGDLHADEEAGDDAGNGKRASTSAQAGQQPEGQQQPPQPETYPQADFKKNVADWSKRIQNGKKVDDLIAFIESKGKPLTEDQKKTLRAVKPKPAEQQGAAS